MRWHLRDEYKMYDELKIKSAIAYISDEEILSVCHKVNHI